ncbi:CHAP domain-containing protein [Nocardia mexicana]|uniref:CHAP domain-containing protein n=1 Tax=Nocardia mexicana TaxID=279262 RepID=A0A370GNN8_9NOCA|nr:CHAP domain-containing protein [Nocardia mexicana]RDI45348.1 CHAP domain-containing protein [Nocardia mexicana]
MTATRDQLIGFLDSLYIPQAPSAGLTSTIHAAQKAIAASILLFASGDGEQQPDLVGWLDEQDLLSDEGLDEPPGESVMAENYASHRSQIRAKSAEMQRQNRRVDDSVFETFNLANETYMSIRDRVGKLDNDLRQINQRMDQEGNYLPLTAAEEGRALSFVLRTVDDVYDAVDAASTQVQAQADGIDRSLPLIQSMAGDSGSSSAGTWSLVSPAGSLPMENGAISDLIVGIAQNELDMGVREEYGNNVVDRPYNINAPWCASFATWVWEKAGYRVNWTNKNYVPDILSDAKVNGWWSPGVSNASRGDMIIFDWNGDGEPDHIGIVESVTKDSITTIEGNTPNNAVESKPYTRNNADIVGVVKQPSTSSPAQYVAV